jgi:hypothetical protein
MKKRNPRQRGYYVLGARGSGKNRVLGRHLPWQDYQAILPLALSDPHVKTLSELVKEVFADATKKQKPSQPETGKEDPGLTA